MMRRFHPGLSAIKSEFSPACPCVSPVPLVGLVFGGIANWCSSGVGFGLIQGIRIGIALVNLKITKKTALQTAFFQIQFQVVSAVTGNAQEHLFEGPFTSALSYLHNSRSRSTIQ